MPMTITSTGRLGELSLHGNKVIPNAFSGNDVYVEPVMVAEEMNISNMTFTPCARTHWHTHEKGQLLRVLAGAGWVCDLGVQPVKISVGAVVWCPAGTTHWHGADDESYMCHQAVSFGAVEWKAKVRDDEYAKKS